jgi:hypothetical protein
MVASEPLIKEYFELHATLHWILYAATIGGVLGLGYLRNRRSTLAPQSN